MQGSRLNWGVARNGIRRLLQAMPLHLLRPLVLHFNTPRSIWARLPPPKRDFTVPVPGSIDGFKYRYIESDPRQRGIYWRGLNGHEGETFTVLLQVLKDASVFLDVGANSGVYTLTACATNKSLKVISVEAAPKIEEILRDHIELNNFGDRVTVEGVALGREPGTAEFLVPLSALPTSSRLSSAPARSGAVDRIQVTMTTVDELVGDGTVDLIKVDVEGSEQDVLVGDVGDLAALSPGCDIRAAARERNCGDACALQKPQLSAVPPDQRWSCGNPGIGGRRRQARTERSGRTRLRHTLGLLGDPADRCGIVPSVAAVLCRRQELGSAGATKRACSEARC